MKISLRSLIENSFYLFAGRIGNMVLNMIQSVVVARGLGVSQLGVWAIVVSSCSLIQSFLSFRTQEPLTRYLVEFKQRKEKSKLQLLLSTAIFTDLSTNIASLILIVTLSPLIVDKLPEKDGIIILFLYAASFVSTSFDKTWYCVARDQRQLGKQTIRKFCITLIKLISILTLYFSNQLNLYNLSLVIFLISLISWVIVWILLDDELLKGYGFNLGSLIFQNYLDSFKKLNGFWSFMKATFLSNIFSSLIKNVDILILGHYRSTTEVGFYQVGKSLSSIVRLAIQSFSSTIYQDFNELIRAGHSQELKLEIIKITQSFLPKLTMISVVFIPFVYIFIQIFYGESYMPSYPIFLLLFISVFINMNLFWSQALILSLDLYNYNLCVIFIAGLINLISGLLLAPAYGANALASITSFSMISIYVALSAKGIYMLNKQSN